MFEKINQETYQRIYLGTEAPGKSHESWKTRSIPPWHLRFNFLKISIKNNEKQKKKTQVNAVSHANTIQIQVILPGRKS